MRAVVLSGPNQFAPAEIEKPQIGPDEILLEMKAAAICGTVTSSAASSPRWALM